MQLWHGCRADSEGVLWQLLLVCVEEAREDVISLWMSEEILEALIGLLFLGANDGSEITGGDEGMAGRVKVLPILSLRDFTFASWRGRVS